MEEQSDREETDRLASELTLAEERLLNFLEEEDSASQRLEKVVHILLI